MAALGAAGLAGCSENAATGRKQLVLVNDAQLVSFADQTWNEVVAKVPPVADPAMVTVGSTVPRQSGLRWFQGGNTNPNWAAIRGA